MICIVNYGVGNIKAFTNIFKILDIPHLIACSKEELKNVTKIILPGVGAFDYAMRRLEESGMRATLDHLVLEQKIPVLGVCVGLQILGLTSEEGSLNGLGWIKGHVKKFKFDEKYKNLPLPHMGWNSLVLHKDTPLTQNLPPNPRFYYLHSYYMECNEADCVAKTEYGITFPSIINVQNIYGIQPHPEKSHENGIKIIQNFCNL